MDMFNLFRMLLNTAIREFKKIYVSNNNGQLEFEIERFGNVWVVRNYNREDFENVFELHEGELLEFLLNRMKENRNVYGDGVPLTYKDLMEMMREYERELEIR